MGMNAVQLYQLIHRTREIPYCRKHDFTIKDITRLEECMRRDCNYLYSLYEEEIEVLRR